MELQKKYLKLQVCNNRKKKIILFKIYILFKLGIALLRSYCMRCPGVLFHLSIAKIALTNIFSLPLPTVYRLVVSPMDTFRYFEFDFFWNNLSEKSSLGKLLDISSPRLFAWRAMIEKDVRHTVISNPDLNDLAMTKLIYEKTKRLSSYELKNYSINELKDNYKFESFDTIFCISVIEHVPLDESFDSLEIIWSLIKPGGILVLSVPCCSSGYEEFLNYNEYGLLHSEDNEFVFSQRFYDQKMINSLIYEKLGMPYKFAIFGEKKSGMFILNRERKLSDCDYEYWNESYFMAENFTYFDEVDDLPGVGVIAFIFKKI